MSDKTFNAKINNKAKKGISPVIATVILVAVAVVIAAALAGFSGSLFSSYSNTQNLSVKNMVLDGNANTGAMTVVNKGASADQITSISFPGHAAGANILPTNVPANGETDVTFDIPNTLITGQQITMKIGFQSGTELTQSVTVGPQ